MMAALRLDRRGASAAEFALVLPLVIILLLAVIDAGRFMWEVNQAEKATQMGARMAVVTDPLAPGLASTYVGVSGLTQGDLIPASALGVVECSNAGCCVSGTTCTTPYPTLGTFNSAAFSRIATRMKAIDPAIADSNVRISYRGSGLGFAGNPNGIDISPLVTVEVTGITFRPITQFRYFAVSLPNFRTTLTAEDMSGTTSN